MFCLGTGQRPSYLTLSSLVFGTVKIVINGQPPKIVSLVKKNSCKYVIKWNRLFQRLDFRCCMCLAGKVSSPFLPCKHPEKCSEQIWSFHHPVACLFPLVYSARLYGLHTHRLNVGKHRPVQ